MPFRHRFNRCSVGLWPAGWDQSVLDVVLGAQLIEPVLSRGPSFSRGTETVREGFVVVGQDNADMKRRLLEQVSEKAPG